MNKINKNSQPNYYNDSSSFIKSGDEIIDLSWEIYFYLERNLPLDHYKDIKPIYDSLLILEELCQSGFISNTDRTSILNVLYKIKNDYLDRMHLEEIILSLKGVISFLKLSNVKSKILIILDQIGNTFYSNNGVEKERYIEKIKSVKSLLKGSVHSQDFQQILHLVNRVEKLYNDNLPIEKLPREEILNIINNIAV